MRKLSYLLVFIIGCNTSATFAQSVLKNTAKVSLKLPPKQNSITFHLQTQAGIGPDGFSSYGIATLAQIQKGDQAEVNGYPVMANKPVLDSVLEYLYILDRPQFYFQGYVSKRYDLAFLKRLLGYSKFNLADTITLSRKPVKCYFSAMVGLNKNKERVYVVDTNNNGDFGDDLIRPLLKSDQQESTVVSNAVTVAISHSYHGVVKQDVLQVFIFNSSFRKGMDLSFMFPEFKYCRFYFNGKPYLMATGSYPTKSNVSVIPDRPYFTSVPKDKYVKIDQFVQLDGVNVKLSDITDNNNQISLTAEDISGFTAGPDGNKTTNKKTLTKNGKTLTSRQAGFMAPLISGYNFNQANPYTKLTTAGLKGKYVFVDFWGTYCGSCIQEFVHLKEAYAQFGRDKFEILGMVDDREQNRTLKILKEHEVTWPNIRLTDKTTMLKGYEDINSYPTSYLLDPSGKIIAVDLRGEALMNKLKMLIGLKKG